MTSVLKKECLKWTYESVSIWTIELQKVFVCFDSYVKVSLHANDFLL